MFEIPQVSCSVTQALHKGQGLCWFLCLLHQPEVPPPAQAGQERHSGEKRGPSSGPIPCSCVCFRPTLLAGLCLLSTRWKEISLGLPEASAYFFNFQCKLKMQQISSEENLQFVSCISQSLQRNGTNKKYIPESWRTREARGIIQSESQSLRTRGANVRGQELDVPVQAKSRFTLPLFSVPFRPGYPGDLLYSVY